MSTPEYFPFETVKDLVPLFLLEHPEHKAGIIDDQAEARMTLDTVLAFSQWGHTGRILHGETPRLIDTHYQYVAHE